MKNVERVYIEEVFIVALSTSGKKIFLGKYDKSKVDSRFEDFLSALAINKRIYQFPAG